VLDRQRCTAATASGSPVRAESISLPAAALRDRVPSVMVTLSLSFGRSSLACRKVYPGSAQGGPCLAISNNLPVTRSPEAGLPGICFFFRAFWVFPKKIHNIPSFSCSSQFSPNSFPKYLGDHSFHCLTTKLDSKSHSTLRRNPFWRAPCTFLRQICTKKLSEIWDFPIFAKFPEISQKELSSFQVRPPAFPDLTAALWSCSSDHDVSSSRRTPVDALA
jgi:hypothetical protein